MGTWTPFKKKYCIVKNDDNGQPEVSTFTEDNNRNRIPLIVDTVHEAIREIGEHMICVADAIQKKDYTEDRAEDAFGDYIAECSLDKKGIFRLYIPGEYEDNIIYEGSYKLFINRLN